jgi:hypothetical protein
MFYITFGAEAASHYGSGYTKMMRLWLLNTVLQNINAITML